MNMYLSDDIIKQFKEVDYQKLRQFNDLYERVEEFMTDKTPLFIQFKESFRETFKKWIIFVDQE